jgi:gas vesicle protein
MKFSTFLVGATALTGLGFYIGNKIREKDEKDDSVVYAEKTLKEKETYGDKVQKASYFAVGALKTGIDKIAEGLSEIQKADMVERGHETVETVKEKAESLKNEIDTLKAKLSSIKFTAKNAAEDINEEFDDVGDIVEDAVEEVKETIKPNSFTAGTNSPNSFETDGSDFSF